MSHFFDGVEFVIWGESPAYRDVQHDRYFDGYYGIQFNYRGRMEVAVGARPCRTESGPCVLITRPGVPFHYGAPPGESRHHIFVCFRGRRVDEWRASGLLPGGDEAIRITAPEPFYWTMRQLHERLDMPGGVHSPRAVLLTEDLLLQLGEQPPHAGTVPAVLRGRLDELAERIRRHPERSWDWEREARKLNLSLVHFRRLFKLLTGLPPHAYQLESRLSNAALLLAGGKTSVRDAAIACGFNDEFYFSRLFRKHRHLTPSAFVRAAGSGNQ